MKSMQHPIIRHALLFILPCLFILSGCTSEKETNASTQRLNFILIYTDELQFSDLGCYGGHIPTPHIDRLASEGLMFTRAYTAASMCTPSRYSVLTGQFPGRCRAGSFLEDNPVTEPYNIAWNTWITEDQDVTFTPAGRDPSVLSCQLNVDSLRQNLSGVKGGQRHRYAGMAQTDHVVGLIRSKLRDNESCAQLCKGLAAGPFCHSHELLSGLF